MANRISIIVMGLAFFCLSAELIARGAGLGDAEGLILQEQYAQAAQECRKVIAQRNPVAIESRAEYLLGICLMKQAKYAEARENFSRLLRRYPGGTYSDEASLAVAHSYFLAADYLEADSKYQRFLRDYPHSELAPIAQVQLKLCRNGGSPANSYFTVQLGCFTQKKNAEQLRDELIDRGYQAYMLELGGDGLYRVRVGEFETRLKAEFLEQRLKDKGYSTKVCP